LFRISIEGGFFLFQKGWLTGFVLTTFSIVCWAMMTVFILTQFYGAIPNAAVLGMILICHVISVCLIRIERQSVYSISIDYEWWGLIAAFTAIYWFSGLGATLILAIML
jgi:hypothetical protein